jgi:hypothetical protein
LLTEPPDADRPPDETVLLPMGGGVLRAAYRRGIIGKRDRTLEPMIRPGTIVHIDTQKRSISLRKDWKHEFQRPIYFLMARDGYVCGWCELDQKSEWLTLAPPVTGLQSQVEVQDRNRNPGTRGHGSYSIDRMNLLV